MTDVLVFDPFEPGFFDDPYPQYAALRDADPVHHSPLDLWVLFRHDDVNRLLRDPSTSVEIGNAATVAERALEREPRSILSIDPPDHTRLRRLVQKAFTPRMVEGLRPRVSALVDDALAGVGGEMDVVADLAFPLPFLVISEMLGMPEGSDRDQLREWSHTLTKTLDPILTPEEVSAALAASEAMLAYLLEVLAWKRANPADDLLTGLLNAEDEGSVLSEDELIDQVFLLFIAGHETTVNLIGNGMLALLRDRAAFAQLSASPSLIGNAVEELLRYDSPVQFSRRIVLTDMTIGSCLVPAGSFVLTGLGAANRDPLRWGDDADTLRLDREGAGLHLSFGSGIHHCLGASLARVEGQVAIGALVSRFPSMALAGDPVANGRVVLRGLDRLPVTLGS
jgi:cytochrome P450